MACYVSWGLRDNLKLGWPFINIPQLEAILWIIQGARVALKLLEQQMTHLARMSVLGHHPPNLNWRICWPGAPNTALGADAARSPGQVCLLCEPMLLADLANCKSTPHMRVSDDNVVSCPCSSILSAWNLGQWPYLKMYQPLGCANIRLKRH